MAVYGDLSTMTLPELLQWLGGNSKTGTLEIERDKVCKKISFLKGRVVASASNDPRELFGHFLVMRGQITEDLLRIALEQQEQNRKPLGTTLRYRRTHPSSLFSTADRQTGCITKKNELHISNT